MGNDAREQATARLGRLRQAMGDLEADAFLVRDTSNVAWLSAFDGVFDEEQAHALLVRQDAATLHTDSRYSAACRAAAGGGPIEVSDTSERHARWLAKSLAACGAAGDKAPSALAIESSISLGEFRALERELAGVRLSPRIVETDGVVRRLRAVKDAGEIARLRAAQAITDAAFSHIVGFMRPGMTEREVKTELEDHMLRHGADGLAFPSIVACGENGASPHAIAGEAVLQAGQCVVMDFGARAQGYCSDMTRTVFLGEPSARLRDAYATLHEANEQVEAMLRPGITGAAAHQLAEDVLTQGGFGGKMGHSLGHGVGLDIHEEPMLSPRNKQALCAGNVVTVEPGIYIEGEFGMRLEDFGIVTENGFEAFTQSTHDMVII